ncbi:MAG TPA: XdhC family protein [Candidatus Dormibacteraeota bacterium]|nr:XdhC family protein [Candidatus Dormibacteraeota bacterium]
MREILERAAKLRAEGRPFAVATVVRTTGSTPQVVGAKLLADDLGRLVGTLGGGCVEADAVDEAKRVLETGTPSLRDYELTEDLAYDTGLVCGGTMWIAIEHGREALRAAQRDLLDDLLAASRGGAPVALATLLAKRGREYASAGRILVESDGTATGSLGAFDERAIAHAREALARGTAQVVPLDDAHELLVEPVTSRPTLVQVGAGHVGLAVARMARLLDFHVIVVDDRPEFANRQRIPEADEVVCADMIRAIEELPLAWNTFVVVATRGHKMDAHAVRAAVKTPARYVGLVGSKRKTILIERMLREEGVPEDRIRSVHAPIGLDLGGRTPAEIALAILAEIEAERYGGSARPLRLSADIFDRTIARA